MNPEVSPRGENRNVIKFLWNIDHFSHEKTLGTLELKFLDSPLKRFDGVDLKGLDVEPVSTEMQFYL